MYFKVTGEIIDDWSADWHNAVMEEIRGKADLYIDEDESWNAVGFSVMPGLFTIHYPYSKRSIRPVPDDARFLGLKNWFRASFGKTFLCSPKNFVIDGEAGIIQIEIYVPHLAPFILRTSLQKDELKKIKKLWQLDF